MTWTSGGVQVVISSQDITSLSSVNNIFGLSSRSSAAEGIDFNSKISLFGLELSELILFENLTALYT